LRHPKYLLKGNLPVQQGWRWSAERHSPPGRLEP
jgi:hypothetical protein